jgi:hypothetical protein
MLYSSPINAVVGLDGPETFDSATKLLKPSGQRWDCDKHHSISEELTRPWHPLESYQQYAINPWRDQPGCPGQAA